MIKYKLWWGVLLALLLLACPVMAEKSENGKQSESIKLEITSGEKTDSDVLQKDTHGKHPGMPGGKDAPEKPCDGEKTTESKNDFRPESEESSERKSSNTSGISENSEDEGRTEVVEIEAEADTPISYKDQHRKHPGNPGEKNASEKPHDGEKTAESGKDSRPESGKSSERKQSNPSGCSCRCDCGKDRSGFGENREGSPREGGRPAPKHHHQNHRGDRDSGSARRGHAPAEQEELHSHRSHHGKQREYAF